MSDLRPYQVDLQTEPHALVPDVGPKPDHVIGIEAVTDIDASRIRE